MAASITAPVTIADTAALVRSGGTDLADIIGNGSINMWAKWKPVPKNLIDTTDQLNSDKTWKTDAQLSNNPWWRGTDGDYGLTYPSVSINLGQTGVEDALTSLVSYITGGRNGWRYLRPNGGASTPYRLIDFNQYNHNAPYPIRQFSCTPSVTAANSSPWEVSAQYMSVDFDIPISNRDYLVPTDVTHFTLYSGIAIFKKSGSTYIPIAWCTGNAWQGQGIKSQSTADGIDGRESGASNRVHTIFSSQHTYYMIPVYFSVELPQPGAGYSALPTTSEKVIVTVPFVDFDTFDCIQASTWQQFAYPDISNHTVDGGSGATIGRYTTDFTLDTTDPYYQGGTKDVRVLIVNQNWDGSYNVNESVGGSTTGCAYNHLFSSVSIAQGVQEMVFGSVSQLTLDLTVSGWKVVMLIDGDATEHRLITTSAPTLSQA